MKNINYFFLVAPMIFSAVGLAAQTSNITIVGAVHVAACEVDPSTQNFDVIMGKFNISQLQHVGDTTTPVLFSIKLTDCPETTNSALIKLDGMADPYNNNLIRLDDVEGSASGIGVAVYDNSGTLLPLWTPSSSYNLQKGNNILNFTAKYVTSAVPVTAGIANATSDFTLNYQ